MTDDLTNKQWMPFQQALESLQGELEALLDMSKNASATVELDQPIGRISRIDAIQQQKMAKANRQNHVIRLQQVNAALNALQEGSYGECRSCEEDIAHRRLQAKPEAAFCLKCQQALESRRSI